LAFGAVVQSQNRNSVRFVLLASLIKIKDCLAEN
jgi:hypothetical protein